MQSTQLQGQESIDSVKSTDLLGSKRSESIERSNVLFKISLKNKSFPKEKSRKKGKKFISNALWHQKNKKNKRKDTLLSSDTTIHIQSTHNNTIYTLANNKGVTHRCVSTGMCGFKNARKSTSYASQRAAEKMAAWAKDYNIAHVSLKIHGLGSGKLSGVRAIHQHGLRITKISERITLPHNGCRPPKRRRV